MRERIESVDRIRQWTDGIPLHYEYTAGIAGEKFLRGLMEGKILAGYCPRCKETFIPPRIYCLECYGQVRRYVEVGPQGKVAALTTKNVSDKEVVMFGYIRFENVRGGLLHKIIGEAKSGDRVRPRFKPRQRREGSILDVEGFQRIR